METTAPEEEWTIVEGGTSFFRLMAADGDEVDFVSAKLFNVISLFAKIVTGMQARMLVIILHRFKQS